MIEKFEVSGLFLASVVQALEEVLYQAETNDWDLDLDVSLIEEAREIMAGPAMPEGEEEDGAEEEGTEDAVEACEAGASTEEVPA